MTEQQMRTAENGSSARLRSGDAQQASDYTSGMGWVRFAGVLMAVIGGFGVIEGLVALFTPTYFVTSNGAVLTINLTGWAWVHLILGVLALVTGLALIGNAPNWARGVGIGLVAINMLVQLAWLPAYPIWSIMAIVLDMVVIGALAITWEGRAASVR